jgi:hypothetical protein
LTDHVRKIRNTLGSGGGGVLLRSLPAIDASPIPGSILAREDGRRLAEGTDRDHPDPRHQARLVPVVEGGDDP